MIIFIVTSESGWHPCPVAVSRSVFCRTVWKWLLSLLKDCETIFWELITTCQIRNWMTAKNPKFTRNSSSRCVSSTPLFWIEENSVQLVGTFSTTSPTKIFKSLKSNWRCFWTNMCWCLTKWWTSWCRKSTMVVVSPMIRTKNSSKTSSKATWTLKPSKKTTNSPNRAFITSLMLSLKPNTSNTSKICL